MMKEQKTRKFKYLSLGLLAALLAAITVMPVLAEDRQNFDQNFGRNMTDRMDNFDNSRFQPLDRDQLRDGQRGGSMQEMMQKMQKMHQLLHSDNVVKMTAMLTGAEEVPANNSPARGMGVFALNKDTNTLIYYVNYQGLEGVVTGAHIHGPAAKGENAGVMVGLAAGKPIMGSAVLTDAQVSDLLAGKTYVNVHSSEYPNGEIRGQLKVMNMGMMPGGMGMMGGGMMGGMMNGGMMGMMR